MNQNYKEASSNKGTCKYCFLGAIDQHADICPYCKGHYPFMPLEEAVRNLLQRGYRLYATRLLTNVNQWSIKKAKEYCDELDIEIEPSYARPIDDLIEELATTGKIMQAIKMVRDQCPVESSWGLIKAKEYVEVMYVNKDQS